MCFNADVLSYLLHTLKVKRSPVWILLRKTTEMSIESELLFAARAGWGGAGDPRK